MARHVIRMPDIGEGIAEVELVAWHVAPGDAVHEDQVLADVMTDKATVEIPSPVEGRVVSLGGAVGQVMQVGSNLIEIELEAAASGPERAAAAPAQASVASTPPPPAPEPQATPAAAAASVPAPAPATAGRPLASPSVRHRARQAGIDLRLVRATGKVGQVTHADLDAHVARAGEPAPAAAAPAQGRPGGETQVPVIGLRRRIAQRMQEAKRRIPHFSYVEECDVTELEALRAKLNAKWGGTRGHLTPLPFIAIAVMMALREFPQVNARFDDEAGVVTQYGAVHLGIATQTDNGLVVPVARDAHRLGLWELSREIARLAGAARSGSATRDELQGSTVTITSLGALGGIASTPIINAPEVAIVGVNRIVERPVFRSGAVVPRLLMNLSSSFDHRVVDGMDAARFIQDVRAGLETPAMLFVDAR